LIAEQKFHLPSPAKKDKETQVDKEVYRGYCRIGNLVYNPIIFIYKRSEL